MKTMLQISLSLVFVLGFVMTDLNDSSQAAEGLVAVAKEPFGETEDGQNVSLYTFANQNNVTVKIMTYGGIVTSIVVPDKEDNFEDIALGFNSLDKYLSGHPYFGAIVGRYGNRIASGKFTIDGEEYSLAANNGPNALHGGEEGFDKKVWNAKIIKDSNLPVLELAYTSEHGEEGYPGELKCRVLYSLNNENELKIEYFAETDRATPVNLTNHSYFNLHGHENMESIEGHMLMLNAAAFTPVDETLIPTGEIRPVTGTPFDFTEMTRIGKRINAGNQQIEYGGGYDHNFVLNKESKGEVSFGGRVHEPDSGRMLEFHTTQPGVQFYTGNFLDGTLEGKKGVIYKKRYGFCLETQHFPNSPNQPEFPSTILRPSETYHHTTIYTFKVKE